jgi:hypothetical protein
VGVGMGDGTLARPPRADDDRADAGFDPGGLPVRRPDRLGDRDPGPACSRPGRVYRAHRDAGRSFGRLEDPYLSGVMGVEVTRRSVAT